MFPLHMVSSVLVWNLIFNHLNFGKSDNFYELSSILKLTLEQINVEFLFYWTKEPDNGAFHGNDFLQNTNLRLTLLCFSHHHGQNIFTITTTFHGSTQPTSQSPTSVFRSFRVMMFQCNICHSLSQNYEKL